MEKHNLTVYDAAHLEFARLYQLPLGTFRWRFAEGSIDGRLAAVVSQNETQIQIPSKTERKAFFSAYYERAERQAMTLLDQGFHLGGVIRVSRDELHKR